MSRHRRPRLGRYVHRSTYLSLWQRYQELLADHEALTHDHRSVLEDHEELLSTPEGDGRIAPAPVVPGRYVTPSWAETEPIPLITTAGLDPAKADSLVRRMRLLDGPAGDWGVTRGETG